MSETYIHIGLHKTGTTFLQNNLFPAIPDLYLLRGWQTYRDLLKTPTQKKVLISDEFISGDVFGGSYKESFYNNLSLIKSTFNNPKIIVGFREQSDFILSLYKQFLHQGNFSSFEDFFNENNTGLLKWEDFYFKERINFLQENFSEVLIYTQELLRDRENDFIKKLSGFLNIEIFNEKQKIKTNFSNKSIHSKNQFETLIFLNKLNKKSFVPNMYSKVFKKLKITPRDFAQNYMKPNGQKFSIIDDSLKKKIEDFYEEDWSFTKQKVSF